MTTISSKDRERLANQPQWVQQLVERLERYIVYYTRQFRVVIGGTGASRVTVNAPSHDDRTPLPEEATIRFHVDNNEYIDVDLANEGSKPGLYLRTSRTLLRVTPRSGNAVFIESADFRYE